MKVVLLCLVSLALVVVSALEDDSYSDFISERVDDEAVDDGTNAISRFLGFKCPKGHRCLPVLECLPCDFGTYKSQEGSDLCENCSPGCTTLRKGAVSRKECVPKCPPGYEESECGKTCTKCRPGFYKSNWKNIKCHPCPKRANWNPRMVGMNKKRQCFQSVRPECHSFKGDVVFALDVSISVTAEDFEKQLDAVNNFIDAFDVSDVNTQFTIYTYPENEAEFKFYSDKSELEEAVSGLRVLDVGYTDVSPFLRAIAENVGRVAGNREDVEDIVIFVMHGRSSSLQETAAAANELKAVTDKVFAVGVGESDEEELLAIASHEDYTVKASNMEELAERLPQLTKDACNLFKEDPEPEDDSSESTDSPPTSDDQSPSETTVTPSSSSGPHESTESGLGQGDRTCSQLQIPCEKEEYEEVRVVALDGSNCRKFCQCAHLNTFPNGTVTYYWEEHDCPPETLFDTSQSTCDHETEVSCQGASSTQPTPSSSFASSGPYESTPMPSIPGIDWCHLGDPCSQEDYAIERLRLLSGTGCEMFCHCAHAEGSAGLDPMYEWVERTCPGGTLFDLSLGICNFENLVDCPDNSPSPSTPISTPGP